MKKRWRLVGILLGLVLLAGVSVWWMFHEPEELERVLKALPADAAWISVHRGLGDRLDELVENPAARGLIEALGADMEGLETLREDAATRALFGRLADRAVALAYLPALPGSGRPAWLATAWIGAQARPLRWRLAVGHVPGCKAMGSVRGHAIWHIESGPDQPPVALTLSEGLLIACVGEDPSGLIVALSALDGLTPSAVEYPSLTSPFAQPNAPPDWGRIDLRAFVETPGAWPAEWAFDLRALGPLHAAVRLRSSTDCQDPSNRSTGGFDRAQAVLGGAPIFAMGLRDPPLDDWSNEEEAPEWLRRIARALDRHAPGALTLALLTDPYSGRFKGLKTPSIIAALTLEKPEGLRDTMHGLFDALNANYRWGLVPMPFNAGTASGESLEFTGDTILRDQPENQPAYLLDGKVLWIGLHRRALGLLFEQPADPQGTAIETPPDTAEGWARADLVRGSAVLRSFTALWSLKMMLEDPAGARRMREQTAEYQAWLNAFSAYERIAVTWGCDTPDTALTITLGPPAAKP